jgi:hypothetical protein
MNNVWVKTTTIPRTTFLAGRATCRGCQAQVRPTTTESDFVLTYTAPTGTARCDVCQTTTDYNLEPARAM